MQDGDEKSTELENAPEGVADEAADEEAAVAPYEVPPAAENENDEADVQPVDETVPQAALSGDDAEAATREESDDFGDDEPAMEGMPIAPVLDRNLMLSRLESLIFASPEPVGVRRLAAILNVDGKTIRSFLTELTEHYANRGIILEEISKGFQFRSHPDNAPILRDIFNLKPLKISKAALEALAIIAYRQPITRAEAEQIRGVDCGGVLKYLFEKNLVRVIGRKEDAGRPIIYGTTKAFLELFGLKSLSDLPALHEFSELWEENQRLVDEEIPPDPNRPPPSPLPGFLDSSAPFPPSEAKLSPATEPEPESETEAAVEAEPQSEAEVEAEHAPAPEPEFELEGDAADEWDLDPPDGEYEPDSAAADDEGDTEND